MLKIKDTKYFIDEENEVVVCTIMDEDGDKFTGVSKCSPEDSFDVETGRRISSFRALLKARQCEAEFIRTHLDTYSRLVKLYENKLDAIDGKCVKYKDAMDGLMS